MLNVEDAAAYLGSSIWFVRSLVWDRKLPKLKFGNHLVFDLKDLDAYIEARKLDAIS